MRCFFMLIMIIALPMTGFCDTYWVPTDFKTIQEAIDAVKDGDTILVHPGTYVENIEFKGKAIMVAGIQGPELTIIDGGNPINWKLGSVVSFKNGEGTDSVLEGFTLTNGIGTFIEDPLYSYYCGGGIYCDGSSPLIRDNIIEKNHANYGSGVYCFESTAMILDNVIVENGGTGLYCDSSCPLIKNNTIAENVSDGIHCAYSSADICFNTISKNMDGIRCEKPSQLYIFFNSITKNKQGGIECYEYCDPWISNNTISENGGPGINCYGNCIPEIRHNMVTKNSALHFGGGMRFFDNAYPALRNNTIAGNSAPGGGGGIFCSGKSWPIVWDTLIWDNSATKGPEIYMGAPSVLTIDYSDVKGGQTSVYMESGCVLDWGPVMIDADPLFVDPAQKDHHIRYGSPCIDKGSTIGGGAKDFEMDPMWDVVDIGADEFYRHLYYSGAATPGGYVEVKIIEKPNTAPVFLFIGSGTVDPPVSTSYGFWYLELPLLFEVHFTAVPPGSVVVLPYTFPPDFPTAWAIPMQALAGDNLTNLMVMEIE